MKIKTKGYAMLKVIATLLIVCVHLGQSLPLPYIVLEPIKFCRHAVSLFFILSGYGIYFSLERSQSVLQYAKRRVNRCIPIYLMVIGINIVSDIILHDFPKDIYKIGFLRYFLLIQGILPSNSSRFWNNSSGLWAMGAIFVFYIFAPIIYKIYCKTKSRNITFALTFVGIALSAISMVVYGKLANIDGIEESSRYLYYNSSIFVFYDFLLGMNIAYLKENKAEVKRFYSPIIVLGLIGCIYKIDKWIISTLFAIIIYNIVEIDFEIQGKIKTRIYNYVLKYSFSIYLGHSVVMFFFGRLQDIQSFSNTTLAIYDVLGFIIIIPFFAVIEKMTAGHHLR